MQQMDIAGIAAHIRPPRYRDEADYRRWDAELGRLDELVLNTNWRAAYSEADHAEVEAQAARMGFGLVNGVWRKFRVAQC